MRILPVVMLMVVACVSPPAAPPPPPPLEAPLLAALRADDAAVRTSAAMLLGNLGDASHVAAVADLLDDAVVRKTAIQALAAIAGRDAQARAQVAEWLLPLLGSGVASVRADAARGLGFCRGCEAVGDELTGRLADASAEVRLAAAAALVQLDLPIHRRDVEDLLASYAGSDADDALLVLLPRLDDPGQRSLLQPLLGSSSPRVRDAAEQAAARLDAIAGGAAPDWQPPAALRRREHEQQYEVAREALRQRQWQPVPRAELLAAAPKARLLLFGEMHWSDGPLRDAQCELLRAFVAGAPEQVALGIEPSVERAQRQVIELARELGVRVVPLERDWQVLQPQSRSADRDDQAAAAIAEWLAVPGQRMFVVRGQSHVLPDGYLARKLPVAPLFVLSDHDLGLAQLGSELDTTGRTWRLGDGVYCCGVGGLLTGSERLQAWLQARGR